MSTGVIILLVVIALIGAVVVSVALAHYSRKRTVELYNDFGAPFADLGDLGDLGQDDSRTVDSRTVDSRTVDSRTVEGHGDQHSASG